VAESEGWAGISVQMTDQLSEELHSVMYRYELNEGPVKRSCSLLQNLFYGTLHVSAREGIHRAVYKYKNI